VIIIKLNSLKFYNPFIKNRSLNLVKMKSKSNKIFSNKNSKDFKLVKLIIQTFKNQILTSMNTLRILTKNRLYINKPHSLIKILFTLKCIIIILLGQLANKTLFITIKTIIIIIISEMQIIISMFIIIIIITISVKT
jgi:hypothetical protein